MEVICPLYVFFSHFSCFLFVWVQMVQYSSSIDNNNMEQIKTPLTMHVSWHMCQDISYFDLAVFESHFSEVSHMGTAASEPSALESRTCSRFRLGKKCILPLPAGFLKTPPHLVDHHRVIVA